MPGRGLAPGAAAYHANLAEAYRALGQFGRAAGCCRTALLLRRDSPEALCNLGLALQGLGRVDEAAGQLRNALQLRPNFAAAHNALGAVLRDQGRLDEALGHFRRAAEGDPQLAAAHSNLGQLLLDLGRADEALPPCQEAVRLQSDLAAAHNNLGNVLRELGRFVEARAAYAEALRLSPDLVPALANLGLTLQREGQLVDALPWLEQAVTLEPDNPDWWEGLGDLRVDRDEPAEAVACYERTLELRPDRAATHLSLGWALQEEGRLAEAAECYRTALRLDPDSGGGAPQHRRRAGGVGRAERGRDLVSGRAAHPAALRPGARPPVDSAARPAAGRRPHHPGGTSGGAARHWPAAGRPAVRPGPGARRAGRLRPSLRLPARGQCPGPRAGPARAARLRPRPARTVREPGVGRLRPGVLRTRPGRRFGHAPSGVRLRPAALGHDADRASAGQPLAIHGAGELLLARRSFEALPTTLGRTEWPVHCLPHLDAPAVRRLAEQHLRWLHDRDGGKAACVVDKMPDNYLYLALVAALFPNAVLIHCRRDLRDVAVSCWMTNFRSIRWANDADHLATRFGQYRRAIDHWRAVLPVPVHEVDYEETVADLEGVARRLVAACGLKWEPACLEFYRTRRPVRTASIAQVRQPLYAHAVARWRNYESALADLFGRLPPACLPAAERPQ